MKQLHHSLENATLRPKWIIFVHDDSPEVRILKKRLTEERVSLWGLFKAEPFEKRGKKPTAEEVVEKFRDLYKGYVEDVEGSSDEIDVGIKAVVAEAEKLVAECNELYGHSSLSDLPKALQAMLYVAYSLYFWYSKANSNHSAPQQRTGLLNRFPAGDGEDDADDSSVVPVGFLCGWG